MGFLSSWNSEIDTQLLSTQAHRSFPYKIITFFLIFEIHLLFDLDVNARCLYNKRRGAKAWMSVY